jgi:hypothetical protein
VHVIRLNWSPWLAPAALVVAHAAFDALFCPLGASASEYPMVGAYLAMGVILVQPVLFALWAALSSQPFFTRLPSATAACVVVVYAQSVSWFRVAGSSRGGTNSLDSFLYILALFGIATLALFLPRRLFAWRIRHRRAENQETTGDLQFSLRHLLSWTIGTAALLGLGRVLANAGALQTGGGPRQTIAQVVAFFGLVCVMLFPSIGVPCLTLASRRPAAWLVVGWLIAWGALTWAAECLFLGGVPTGATASEAAQILLIQVGAAAAGLVSALALRIAGFRLQRG